MPGSRITPPVFLCALAMGAASACSSPPPNLPQGPFVARSRPTLFAAESDPPCPAIAIEEERETKGATRAPSKEVSLAVFLKQRAPAPPPRKLPRLELGTIVHLEGEPPRRDRFDVNNLDLPLDLPRVDLPDALRAGWDEVFSIRDKLRHVRSQQNKASRKLAECRERLCPLERCIARLAGDLTARMEITESARRAKLSQFIEDLQTYLARLSGPAKPGATLALAYAAQERLRDNAPLSDFEAPIALYDRARQTAKPGSDTDWWARYELGSALIRAGQSVRAGREFAALAALPAAPKLRAEASFRQGELEADPGRAAAAFQTAMALSGSDPTAMTLHWAAGYRLADMELTRRHFAAAIAPAAAAIRALERSASDDADFATFFDLLTPPLAQALGALSGADLPSPPSVPAAIMGPLGAAVADNAVLRFDIAAAMRAWEAVLAHAPESFEAPRALTGLIAAQERLGKPEAALPLRERRARDYGPTSAWAARLREAQASLPPDNARLTRAVLAMPPPLPKLPVSDLDRERDLIGRAQALLTACDGWRSLEDPNEIDLRVEVGPPARITAQALKGSEGFTELAACVTAQGPAYFVDAPADLKVTIRFDREGTH